MYAYDIVRLSWRLLIPILIGIVQLIALLRVLRWPAVRGKHAFCIALVIPIAAKLGAFVLPSILGYSAWRYSMYYVSPLADLTSALAIAMFANSVRPTLEAAESRDWPDEAE